MPAPETTFLGRRRAPLGAACLMLAVASLAGFRGQPRAAAPPPVPDRSPVDLVLTADEKHLLTANQTAGTVSLVDLATGAVRAEVACGDRPSALALTPDGRTVLVSATSSGQLCFLQRRQDRLVAAGRLRLGFEPRGV